MRKIGVSAARELFLTGERFTAARAAAIGLVHRVVKLDELDAAVDERVRELLQAAPGAVAAAKALVHAVAGRPVESVRELVCKRIAERRASAEGQEGLRAFLEKRKPDWGGGGGGGQVLIVPRRAEHNSRPDPSAHSRADPMCRWGLSAPGGLSSASETMPLSPGPGSGRVSRTILVCGLRARKEGGVARPAGESGSR